MRGDIETWVGQAVEEHRLTGLTVGVQRGEDRVVHSTGWANKEAEIEARPEGVHQIGSITKLYTTTIVNRLLVDGKLDLDDALPDVLPEVRLPGDPDLSAIKVHHLLTHTSGLPGDAFFETGEGDENLARWIDQLAVEDVGLEAAPGERWSYCNSAFNLLGRVIEHRTGLPYRQAMRTFVTKPLGILTPVVTAREAIRFRVAVGHATTPSGEVVSRPWAALPVSSAPAGSTPSARAGDLLTFARAHLDPADERLAPRAALDALQEARYEMPSSMAVAQGLGWMIHHEAPKVIGHGGSTQTQHSMLLASRDADLATVVFSNDLHGTRAVRQLSRKLWRELGGVDLLADPTEVDLDDAADLAVLVGTYERFGNRIEVTPGEGRTLGMRVSATTAGEELALDMERVAPASADGTQWVVRQPLQEALQVAEFREWEDGRPKVLHLGGRANVRRD